jgi:hypothetical protein
MAFSTAALRLPPPSFPSLPCPPHPTTAQGAEPEQVAEEAMGVAGDVKGAVQHAGDEINNRAEAGLDKVSGPMSGPSGCVGIC